MPDFGKKFVNKAFVLFLLFLLYSFFVAAVGTANADFNLTTAFQKIIPRFFDLPFSAISVLGSAEITYLLSFILAVFLFLHKNYRGFLGLVFFPVITLIEFLGKIFIYHPPPPADFYRGVIHLTLPSQFIETPNAYPSGHVARTTFLVVVLVAFFYSRNAKHGRKILALSSFLLIAVLVSRVYLGEHWSSDVLGGFLLGGSLGLFSGALLIPRRGEKIT